MRRLIMLFSLVILGALSANAQELGTRIGNVNGGDIALDAVFSSGNFSRIHADVSFGKDIVGIDALWDFLYRPFEAEGETFFWYVGAGPFLGIGDDFTLGAAGEIGVEYHFPSIPLAIGLDWRPGLRIIDDTDFSVDGFGLNLRYVFGK
ncbi:MAG: outer membrane insertion C- signal [Cytophagia bacterium]|nr:outer membrane insertion C- signal [Cytophagia bacterium]